MDNGVDSRLDSHSPGGRERQLRIVSSTPTLPGSPPAQESLQLLLRDDPPFWRFVTNLAACTAAPPGSVPKWAWKHTPMFRSAFLRGGDPTRGMLLSVLVHVVILTAIISLPPFDIGRTVSRSVPPTSPHEVIYYTKADLLPLISPPKQKVVKRPAAKPAPKPVQQAAAASPQSVPVKLAYHPLQKIESRPSAPDNRKQTIIQPEAPVLPVQKDVRVPNLISWNAPALPSAPPVPVEVRKKIEEPTVPPAPKPPVEAAIPAPPKVNALRVNAAAIPLTPAPTIEAPRLPVPVHVIAATAKQEPLKTVPAVLRTTREMPSAPDMKGDVPLGSSPVPVPDLVAISVAPAPPEEKIAMPIGTRAGEFAASPEGVGEDSTPGTASAAVRRELAGGGAKGQGAPGGESGTDLAELHVPGLTISGGDATPPISALRARDSEPDLKKLMANATRPSLLPPGAADRGPQGPSEFEKEKPEAKFFGARRVYTVYMNMPNLASGGGGSWVLRFAELHESPRANTEDLATPEAIHKVDPMYVASAARDKVEGTVTLAAIILSDGSVSNVRVVNGLDPRLDTSAVAALTQWRFLPALKNGSPVDLEVLVQIPFKLHSPQGF